MMKMLAHAHGAHAGTESIFDGCLWDVILDTLLETLFIVPFLFLAYLIMEFIEHKASERTLSLLTKSGKAGPAVGSLLGAAPQCAFSAIAANLYTGRVITVGTLIAVFLSTSDEMLLIMISEGVSATGIFISLGYKMLVGCAVGFALDFVMRLFGKGQISKETITHPEGCDHRCERGILRSAVHHTLTVSALILAVTGAVNLLVFFVGSDAIGSLISSIPVLSHLLSALIGLIPGCATSVALTTLCTDGIISGGVMMSGLFSGAGVGLLVLLRMNNRWRDNLAVMGLLALSGFVFGLLFDLTGLSAFIA